MATKDAEALPLLALADYVAGGGPQARDVGRIALLDGAAAFFAEARIDAWQVEDMEVREHGDVAVCSYRWSERGEHAGAPFALAGHAADALVMRDARWRVPCMLGAMLLCPAACTHGAHGPVRTR